MDQVAKAGQPAQALACLDGVDRVAAAPDEASSRAPLADRRAGGCLGQCPGAAAGETRGRKRRPRDGVGALRRVDQIRHDRVVNGATHRGKLRVVAGGMHAITQEHHVEILVRINPE